MKIGSYSGSKKFFLLLFVQLIILIIFFSMADDAGARLQKNSAIANAFLLSDVCLSTESRHSRHPALPDMIAPFQNFPGFYDHYISSSFINIPYKNAEAF